MKRFKKLFYIIAGSILLFGSCTYHNEADYFKDTTNLCNTDSMSFQTDVYPVIENSCVGCHSNFEGYDNVKRNYVKMMKAIEHKSGAPAMPQGASKLPVCTINQLNAWIDQGLKNN